MCIYMCLSVYQKNVPCSGKLFVQDFNLLIKSILHIHVDYKLDEAVSYYRSQPPIITTFGERCSLILLPNDESTRINQLLG